MSEKIYDRAELNRLLEEWVDASVNALDSLSSPAIFGILTRGVPLGRRVKREYEKEHGSEVPFGQLDITLYRDDLDRTGARPVIEGTECMFDLENREILLVDDILFTGRTVRAALNEIFDFGRPARVLLSVLVDRDHRELPIAPDIAGTCIDVTADRMVRLRLEDVDDRHGLFVEDL